MTNSRPRESKGRWQRVANSANKGAVAAETKARLERAKDCRSFAFDRGGAQHSCAKLNKPYCLMEAVECSFRDDYEKCIG